MSRIHLLFLTAIGCAISVQSQQVPAGPCAPAIPELAKVHSRNWSRIVIAPFASTAGELKIGKISPVSRRPGFNNQPSFSHDGNVVYWSWRPDGSQADIWALNLATGMDKPVTCTSEEEYSPEETPDGSAISVVRVETLTRRRLWKIPLNGAAPVVLFPTVTTIAYYTWIDSERVLFYFTDPQNSDAAVLALGNSVANTVHELTRNVGPTLANVPNSNEASYVDESDARHWKLMALDRGTQHSRVVAEMPPGIDNYAWLRDGNVIAPRGFEILELSRSTGEWKKAADLHGSISGPITRIVVDRAGRNLLLVLHED